jgi:TonB family protein
VAPFLQQQLEGKYEILEKIKEGGMGAVYKVRHRFLDEIRVVKVIRSALGESQELSDRFLREARMAIRLRHPSIAVLHDFAVADDGQAFIVMEYIAGLTLDDVLRTGGPPPLGLALEIASQALRAMGYLHRHGFVHRDIAPDNLMLTRGVDGEPLVKLIDLGIAKVLAGEGAATTTGIFLGKPRYASPEHFGTREMDHRSDLYSFGVVLYELLTGQCPVAGHDPASYMAGHLFRPPLDFAESDPHGALPAELRPILLCALAKTPAERFPSAADFARALAPLQERSPVQAGDLEAVLQPSKGKTAPWSAAAPAGSSQVLLDQQFLAGTTPPPAAHGGSHLSWDPRLVAPETLPPPPAEPRPQAAAKAQPGPPPPTARAPAPGPALDETLPLTNRQRMPGPPAMPAPLATMPPPATPAPPAAQAPPAMPAPLAVQAPPAMPAPLAVQAPAAPRRPAAALAARTLAGVQPAMKPGTPGTTPRELPLPGAAARQEAAAPTAEDWEARPLHRTGPPGAARSAAGGGPTLGFKQAAPALPSAAEREAQPQAARSGGRATWAWAAGAVLLAGALGGAWWYRHPRPTAGVAGALPTGDSPKAAIAAPRPPSAASTSSTGTAGAAGVKGAAGAAGAVPAMPPAMPQPAAGRAADRGAEEQRASAGAKKKPAAPAAGAPAAGAAPATDADRAAAANPAPERLGPGAEAAEPVDVPDAIYPAAALGTGKSPTVLLAVLVDERGNVADVRVKEGDSSHLGFNEAAVAAARKARFLAATKDGAPVRSWSELMIEFVSPPHH